MESRSPLKTRKLSNYGRRKYRWKEETIVVAVKNYKTHPVYKKRVEVRKKYHVDDQQQIARPGDTVEIEECRPLSATKRFRLVRVISKGE